MIGITYSFSKNARVWCVMNDRPKEKLLTYMKNNIYTLGIEDNSEFATRIYSDCFSSYREEDFTNMGYVFAQGEPFGLVSIKHISNNFAGINFKLLDELDANGTNP